MSINTFTTKNNNIIKNQEKTLQESELTVEQKINMEKYYEEAVEKTSKDWLSDSSDYDNPAYEYSSKNIPEIIQKRKYYDYLFRRNNPYDTYKI